MTAKKKSPEPEVMVGYHRHYNWRCGQKGRGKGQGVAGA